MIVIFVVIMVLGVMLIFLIVLSSICYICVMICIGNLFVIFSLWDCLLGLMVGLFVVLGVILIIDI